MIQRIKKSVNVPVTTGEIWNIWRDHPQLANSADFIGAHVLPYWENFTHTQAVDQAVAMYQLLRDQFPGKRIVIAEFGWPSAGYNLRNAEPGAFEQASVLRNFVTRAEAIGMDYNIVEAIDQPWKFYEGGVGPYWGILDASREPKFAWTGPIVNENYWKLAAIALLVGILMSLPILRLERPTIMQALVLSAAANGVGAWAATVFAYWTGHYFVFGSAFALTLGLILLVPLVLIAMARIDEIAAIAFGRGPRRLITKSAPLAPATIGENVTFPKVSIHIPAYYEPVEMLKQTLDAVSRLDYPNFECVCIINNTPDPEFWQPIQDHCRALGERFKFINAEKVAGLQGRCAPHRHGPHRGGRRNHRHHRRRLCRASGLAEGSGSCVRRPPRRPGAGAAGASRRRPLADALHHERRICRVLRHRHGSAQRTQRHHRARHDVPDPPRPRWTWPAAGPATPSARIPISA